MFVQRQRSGVHVFPKRFVRLRPKVAEATTVTDEVLRLVRGLALTVVEPCAEVTTACTRNRTVNDDAEPFIAIEVFHNATNVSTQVPHVATSVVTVERFVRVPPWCRVVG